MLNAIMRRLKRLNISTRPSTVQNPVKNSANLEPKKPPRPSIGSVSACGLLLNSCSTGPPQSLGAEELTEMEQTLEKYAAAFESLSLPQVRQVWPGLDLEHETAFKKVFAAFRETAWTRSLALECAAPQVSGETANVECLQTLNYGKPKGKSKEVGPSRVAILLRGQSSNWVVADMKGAN